MRKYGDESWELDALSPDYLAKLVRRHAEQYIDEDIWKERQDRIDDVKVKLTHLAETF